MRSAKSALRVKRASGDEGLLPMKFMIRAYGVGDYDQVVALFIRINREIAPDHMREQF